MLGQAPELAAVVVVVPSDSVAVGGQELPGLEQKLFATATIISLTQT